ncbi:MAG: hypothetical protein C0391_03085 [Anaerolinea sp.]|nr:hypothetical protein [Anaerolinea sp.]
MLVIDYYSWPYAFAVGSLIFAIVLSSPVNLQTRSEINGLAGNLAITGISYFAILSANPATLLIGWAALDMIELIVLLRNNPESLVNQRIIIGYMSRFLGLLFIYSTFIMGGRSGELSTGFISLSSAMGLPVLLGIVLRLSPVPLHIQFNEPGLLRRSQGNILRFIPAATSLVLLSRIPQDTFKIVWVDAIRVMIIMAVLYSAIKWIKEEDELDSRPYWVFGISGLAILSTINGSPNSSVSWGVSLVLIGGMIFIHARVTSFIKGLLFASLIFLSGFPYTPNAPGLSGLMGSPSLLNELICLFLFLLMLLGLFIRIKNKQKFPQDQERINYLVYPMSILLLIFTYIMIGLFGWPGSRTMGAWTAITLAVVLVAVFLLTRKWILLGLTFLGYRLTKIMIRFPLLKKYLGGVHPLAWMAMIIANLVRWMGFVVGWSSYIFEGRSGLLWSLVFLVLLLMALGNQV